MTRSIVALALLAPWLVPPQGGPSPSVSPWLFSVACTGLLASLLPAQGWRAWLPYVLLAGCLAALIGLRGQNIAALAAALAILVMLTGAVLAASRPQKQETGAVLAAAWPAAALLSSVIGLCQYFGVEQYFALWMSPSGTGEAFANLRQRNQFATLTNMGLLAVLWWAARAKPLAQRGLLPLGLMLAAVLLALGNVASASRTGLVQLAFIAALAWLWGTLRQALTRRLLVTAILTYVVAALTLPGLAGQAPSGDIFARLQHDGPACASRLTLWRNVLHLISLHPWWGWGWGELDYAHFITLYAGPRFCEMLDNAHNLPLHLAVELGIPAALLMCGGAVWLVLRARPWREADATRQMAWGVLALILLHSMLEYPLWYGPFQMAFGLCLGLLWPARAPTAGDPNTGGKAVSPLQAALAALLMAAAAYAAWDYHRISQIYLAPEARSAALRDNALEKILNSWLFREQVRFAELTTTPMTRENAAQINTEAQALLHFSPESRVVEKLIESAVLLGRDGEARFYLARYRAAYPEDHARWAQVNAR